MRRVLPAFSSLSLGFPRVETLMDRVVEVATILFLCGKNLYLRCRAFYLKNDRVHTVRLFSETGNNDAGN